MSLNPFQADPKVAVRHAALVATIGADVEAELATILAANRRRVAENLGGIVEAEDVARLVARFALEGPEELMLLALPVARRLANPPISSFFVGAVGREQGTGNLVLGGNLEFPGTHLGFTVHGEGFVFTRAASRGSAIATIAIGEAHPCAYCRQYLSEFAASRELQLIDPLGHRLTMAELFPWPFDPEYLGDAGYVPGKRSWSGLALAPSSLPEAVATRLVATARHGHAPYSKCPGAVVLVLNDGNTVAGAAIESVAFNPTMGPLQAALIDLAAHGYAAADIASVALATRLGGAVDYAASTTELLSRLAPGTPLTIVGWA